jgi:hypothetical protein
MINSAAYHKSNFSLTKAMGEKLNAGDATFAPIGYGSLYLLIKQFPHPKISGGTEIEVPFAGGGTMYDQSPIKTSFQGQVTFLETAAGTCQQFLKDVLKGPNGKFDARIYEGTPARHLTSYKVVDCFINMDASDRDWENKQQVLMLNGTIFGHFFGDTYPGNI